MPDEIQDAFLLLVDALLESGPTGSFNRYNYGKLPGTVYRYHCRLAANPAYVACWDWYQDALVIEVCCYAGSEEDVLC